MRRAGAPRRGRRRAARPTGDGRGGRGGVRRGIRSGSDCARHARPGVDSLVFVAGVGGLGLSGGVMECRMVVQVLTPGLW